MNRKYYLLNFVFVSGLILLFINDHFLKWEYHNWFTGKLSDFVGILIFPMLITFFFPKSLKTNLIVTGIFFIFWKSEYSQSFIDLYNSITPIQITRVVDYTDLLALSMLPLTYFIIKRVHQFGSLRIQLGWIKPVAVLIPAIVIFMATSPPHRFYYTHSSGKLHLYGIKKTVKLNKSEVLYQLSKHGYQVYNDNERMIWGDTITLQNPDHVYYKIDTIVIEKDTLRNLRFALQEISSDKTTIWINGVDIPDSIPDHKVERKLRRYYKKLIKKHIKEHFKK
ncbi:hypothetical protein [Winogradskyella sp. 3972H.M.0a.05]|uniref:hypothetical protein n=1 Tax=Winogradskyella sp. 3972H.M.0a.05 TaxID=2950277 RepID=UPI0033939909